MKSINLTSSAWCELVFEGRNKNYGAYSLRRESSNRHLAALLIMISLGVAIAWGVSLYNKFTTQTNVNPEIDTRGQVVLVELNPIEKPTVPQVPVAEPPTSIRNTVKFTPPVVTPDDKVMEDDFKPQDALNLDKNLAIGTVDYNKGTNDATAPFIEDLAPTRIEKKEDVVRDFVEQMPEYPGGSEELMKFLSSNIKYPTMAQELGIQGTVLLRFVVGTDGSVSNIQVIRSVDASCDKEAVRVVKMMHKWIPGRQNGSAVSVYFTLPVRFKLANSN